MKKKILIVLAVLAALVMIAFAAMYALLVRNPNLFFSLMAEEIREGEPREVTFEYEYDETFDDEDGEEEMAFDGVPAFEFFPQKSTGYTVSVTDVKSDADVFINMSIVDDKLEDIGNSSNYDGESGALTDSVTGDAMMQAERQYFILIETSPGNESVEKYSGSFVLTVNESPEEEKPPEIVSGGSVDLEVEAQSQACASFRPLETGYYRFSTMLGKNDGNGYSTVSSVTSSDKLDIDVTDGICHLEKDKEYYVWTAVYETNKKVSDVTMTCTPMMQERAKARSATHLTGDTVIEFVPEVSGNIAVYSHSDGDPSAVIYEKAGFPLRTDGDSETSLSDNPDDIAVVFAVEAGTPYRICLFGGLKDCTVIITDYLGDGSSLTPEDLAPLDEEALDEEAIPETEGEDETETDGEEAE